jgi:hypothetical protein
MIKISKAERKEGGEWQILYFAHGRALAFPAREWRDMGRGPSAHKARVASHYRVVVLGHGHTRHLELCSGIREAKLACQPRCRIDASLQQPASSSPPPAPHNSRHQQH